VVRTRVRTGRESAPHLILAFDMRTTPRHSTAPPGYPVVPAGGAHSWLRQPSNSDAPPVISLIPTVGISETHSALRDFCGPANRAIELSELNS
jgi:hypothetical protein